MTLLTAVRYSILNQDKSSVLKQSPEAGAEFVVKEGVEVPALPIALKTMKKGEKASLIIKASCRFLPLFIGHLIHQLLPLILHIRSIWSVWYVEI